MEVSCQELFEAAQEYQVRELSFWVCANMVANALGRCEFRTFRNHQEIQEREYYLWNVSPNVNQNSSMFLHKLVAKLYQDNEALIVDTWWWRTVGRNRRTGHPGRTSIGASRWGTTSFNTRFMRTACSICD